MGSDWGSVWRLRAGVLCRGSVRGHCVKLNSDHGSTPQLALVLDDTSYVIHHCTLP